MLAGVSGDSGTVTVQILPFETGARAAAAIGSFAILHYHAAPGLGVVHMGGGVIRSTAQAGAAVPRQFLAYVPVALLKLPVHPSWLVTGPPKCRSGQGTGEDERSHTPGPVA
jgi:hypothetical protein